MPEMEKIVLKDTKEEIGDGKLSSTEVKAIQEIKTAFESSMKDKKWAGATENIKAALPLIESKFTVPEWTKSTEGLKNADKLNRFVWSLIFDIGTEYFIKTEKGDVHKAQTDNKVLLDTILPFLKAQYGPKDANVNNLQSGQYREIEWVLKEKMRDQIKNREQQFDTKEGVTKEEMENLQKDGWKKTREYTVEGNVQVTSEKTKHMGNDFKLMYGEAETQTLDGNKVKAIKAQMEQLLNTPGVDKSSVKIQINSSASNIPYKDNMWLAEGRGEEMRQSIMSADPTAFKPSDFVINPSVWGPEFNRDAYKANPKQYHDYQYAEATIVYKQTDTVKVPETRYDLQKENKSYSTLIDRVTDFSENIQFTLTKAEADKFGLNTNDPEMNRTGEFTYHVDFSSRRNGWRSNLIVPGKLTKQELTRTPDGPNSVAIKDKETSTQISEIKQALVIDDIGDNSQKLAMVKDILITLYGKDKISGSGDNGSKWVLKESEEANTTQLRLTDQEMLAKIHSRGTKIYDEKFTAIEKKI